MEDTDHDETAKAEMPGIVFRLDPLAANSALDFASRLYFAKRITTQDYNALTGPHDSLNSARNKAFSLYSSDAITSLEYDSFLALVSAKESSSGDGSSVDYGNMDRTMAAASKVFNTNELLDLILQQLESSDNGIWKRVKLTCKSFKATMNSSPRLRQRTNFAFYKNVPQPTVSGRAEYFIDLKKLGIYKELKTNKRFPKIDLSDTTDAASSFSFTFRSIGVNGAFERYRSNLRFRNTRVYDEPLERIDLWAWFDHANWKRSHVAVAPGQDITFGQLFDKVASLCIDNLDPVTRIIFSVK